MGGQAEIASWSPNEAGVGLARLIAAHLPTTSASHWPPSPAPAWIQCWKSGIGLLAGSAQVVANVLHGTFPRAIASTATAAPVLAKVRTELLERQMLFKRFFFAIQY